MTLFLGGAQLCCTFYQPQQAPRIWCGQNQFHKLNRHILTFCNKSYCLESHTEHLWRCSYTTKLKKNIDYQDSRTSSLLVKSLIIDYQDSRTSSLLVKSLIWYTKEKTNILWNCILWPQCKFCCAFSFHSWQNQVKELDGSLHLSGIYKGRRTKKSKSIED
jgi:hypothetical protein